MAFNRAFALRAATHLATWMPFLYGALSAVRHGWRPISDNAGIAIRSWDVLTSYGPLLGQPSRLARGVYDPGPLQYWLLTVPTHLDPRTGVLWGAALWCIVACSLAIEAARSAAGPAGGLLAGGTLLAALLWIPGITRQPVWNPWFGLMFFLAALAAAWAVMSGHRGWWPVLMICASVAAQGHLMYAMASGALVLVALIAGLADTIRARASYRWLAIGLLAGLACWSAPLIQQFTAPHGNLGALITNSSGGTGQKGGFTFGLQAVAASVQPPPLWWTSFPAIRSLGAAAQRPAAVGVVTLVLVAAVLVIAIRLLPSRRVAALAGISLLVSAAAVYTYSAVPAANISQRSTTFNSLTYLMAPMLPIGVLAWLTVICGAVLVSRRFLRSQPAPAPVAAGTGPVPAGTEPAPAAATAASGAAATAASAGGGEPPAAGRGSGPGADTAPGADGPPPAGGGPATGSPAGRPALPDWALPALATGAVAVLALVSVLAIGQNRVPQSREINSVTYAVTVASQKIEARLRGQPIALTILGRDRHFRRRLTFALVYALNASGYRPEVEQKFAWQLGPAFTYHGQQIPQVTVHMRTDGIGVVVRNARPSLTRNGS